MHEQLLSRPGFLRLASRQCFGWLVRAALLSGVITAAWAQPADLDPDWAEGEVPQAPAYRMDRLIAIDVNPTATLQYGLDPASLSISRTGIVRYVIVAYNNTGARNVLYEGIRCATGEVRTYARQDADGGWTMSANSPWRALTSNMPSRHPLRLARGGLCDGGAPASSVGEITRALKQGVQPKGSG